MRLNRWASVMLMALPMVALACSGDGNVQLLPEELTTEEELLQSMVLTGQDVGEVFPGLSRTVSGPQRDFISEGQRDAGVVAVWSESYEAEGRENVSIGLQLYGTADEATLQFAEQSGSGPGFDVGEIGEESQAFSSGANGCFLSDVRVRIQRVLALVRVSNCGDEDMSEEARQLAQKLAEKIEAVNQELADSGERSGELEPDPRVP